MSIKFSVRKVVRGKVEAEAIVCPDSFSFLGDVDMATSEIIADDNPNRGQKIAGKILIYRETKGSSGGCVVLMTLAQKGLAPAGLCTIKRADYNLTEGAILSKIPFVCEPDGDLLIAIKTGSKVLVDADAGFVEIVE